MYSDFEEALDKTVDSSNEQDLNECKLALLQAFPKSFMNENNELIAHLPSNTYLCLSDCKRPEDIECKVFEWFSRPAFKGAPYSQEWRNRKFRKFMLDGVNNFLDTDFSKKDMEEIYLYLGNAIDHSKTVRFVESRFDFSVLQEE